MMKKELYIGTVTFVLVIALIYMPTGYAQNLTKNASNAAGNASAGVNQTGSQLQKNASELGKNASEVGGQIVNKTEDVGKKIAGGLGSLLGNASEKLKEGSK
jgi:predicted PurR-regulated permease PerM